MRRGWTCSFTQTGDSLWLRSENSRLTFGKSYYKTMGHSTFFKKCLPFKYFLKKKIWKANNQFSILNPFPFWWVRPSQGKTCAEQLAACILHMWGGTAIREPRKNGYESGCRCFFSFSLITHRLSTFLIAEKQSNIKKKFFPLVGSFYSKKRMFRNVN